MGVSQSVVPRRGKGEFHCCLGQSDHPFTARKLLEINDKVIVLTANFGIIGKRFKRVFQCGLVNRPNLIDAWIVF